MLKKGIFALALFIAMPLYAAEYWIDVGNGANLLI